MSKERYSQIIDEVYNIYIQKCREDRDEFIKNNPDTLIDYREDTKEIFIESIKNNRHWFGGKLGFADEWGLKIEERELSSAEMWEWYNKNGGPNGKTLLVGMIVYQNEEDNSHIKSWLEKWAPNVPTKQITLTYQNETIQFYE
jgi:hypothetical protein